MLTLSLSEKASKQFTDAAQWYEKKAVGLGDRFSDIIQGKLQLIQQFPERYPKRKKNFREAIVKTFPYIIVYSFYKTERTIIVHTIFHSSRDPRKKYKPIR